jgi:aspartate/methionine/tyrosine aminotransferase
MKNLQLRYGHHRGSPELRETIAKDCVGVSPDQICVTTGASEANFALVASLVGFNDRIIVEHPNYPSLYEVPRSLDRRLDLYHLSYAKQFIPDLGELESMMSKEVKLVSITHPNNPTGSTISNKILQELVNLVERYESYLLVDETYRELSFDSPPNLAATLSPRAITITSMSKAYRLPGIRIGWVVADKSIIEKVRAVREQLTICNPAISEQITLAVLRKKRTFLNKAKRLVKTNFELLKEWMANNQDLEWVVPKGGVVGFPRFKDGRSTKEFCQLLVKKYKTFVVPGYCFEMDDHFRIGYGGETKELKSGLNRVNKALEDQNYLRTV